ncbi:MAG: DUF2891 domain-containing protein [Acidimicrobiales bacterium]
MIRELAENAAAWAEAALRNVVREFPHATLLRQDGPEDRPRRPRETHAAFYGAYDWHSSVEMHWSLVRLLRVVPGSVPEAKIREQLDRHFAPASLEAEAANLPSWERPYGFAWALMLAGELARWEDPDARRWSLALEPLVARVIHSLVAWLEIASYPVRSGMHGNSAFALSLSLRSARLLTAPRLVEIIDSKARGWFLGDIDYPARYEPSGTDFLSPALSEAELMTQVLREDEYPQWLESFLPGLSRGEPRQLFTPVEVSDATDGMIAHLHGLNLSRAWCWKRITEALPRDDPRLGQIAASAKVHAAASLGEATGSDYMVEHWLAAYAVLLSS